MYLERVEPREALTIYSLVRRYALNCGLPVEVMSFESFQETVFNTSMYFWWREVNDIAALVNIGAIDAQARKAEFGVISLRKRQGFAAAACFAVLEYGFETLNLHKMYAIVNADNDPSIALCNKHGMVVEGVIRDGRFKQGQYVDQVIFGVKEDETHIWKPGERRVEEDASSGSGSNRSGGSDREGDLGAEGSEEGGRRGQEDKKAEPRIRLA